MNSMLLRVATHPAAYRMIALTTIATLLLAAQSVSAQYHRQGVAEALPQPISSLSVIRLADELGLSGEQRHAWEAGFERYKAGYRELYENGAVARFVERRAAIDGIPFTRQFGRREIDAWLAAHKDATDALAALDEALFAAIEPVLTDSQ